MRILQVNTRETADTITIFASCKIRRVGYDEAYFTFDKKYKPFLKVDASPFAAALLIPSMRRGEDLVIEDIISEELYAGMHEIMKLVLSWRIGLKPIKIIAPHRAADIARPTVAASFFSGGVDSFYTFLKHKKDRKDPVTHLLLVNGYDIDPRNKNLWTATLQNIQKVANAEKASLIEVESNLRSLVDPIFPWDYTHGGCLAAVGLCLRKGLKQVYVPSSCTVAQQIPWGTHLELDNYWSTETLSFIHDGTEASRIDKIAWQIAKSPIALKSLRVCYMNEKDAFNCGVCEKCLRTMINLYVVGALHKAETFPRTLDPKKIATMQVNTHIQQLHKENLAALIACNAPAAMQDAQRACLADIAGDSVPLIQRMIAFFIYLDYIYLRGNLYKVAQSLLGRKF
jgi:hypothetical protein